MLFPNPFSGKWDNRGLPLISFGDSYTQNALNILQLHCPGPCITGVFQFYQQVNTNMVNFTEKLNLHLPDCRVPHILPNPHGYFHVFRHLSTKRNSCTQILVLDLLHGECLRLCSEFTWRLSYLPLLLELLVPMYMSFCTWN